MWITKERDEHGESRERQDNNDGTNDDKGKQKRGYSTGRSKKGGCGVTGEGGGGSEV